MAVPEIADEQCALAECISATDIEQMSMSLRRRLVQHLHGQLQQQIPGCGHPFAAIESTLEFFDARGWGRPGTWISVVDSYVLEAVLCGVSTVIGEADDANGNPGAAEWVSYLKRLSIDPRWHRTDRHGHDRAWARAEHVATEYGRAQADTLGIPHDGEQYRWYLLSSMYRSLMADPPRVLRLPIVSWCTDVTTRTPVRAGAEVAYGLARLDPTVIPGATARVARESLLGFVDSVLLWLRPSQQ